MWALENIKENGFDASFFVFFHFIGAPVFIVTLLRPSLPVAPCLKNVNKALQLLAFCRLCRAMAWQAVGLVRLSYVPHSKNGWALHENWLSNWKWKVMLKCTIMNGFCGPLLLPTSLQVLAPSNLLLHSLTVASRWRSSSSWRQERHLCWRDLKMLDDGFQHHVGGHDVQLSIIAMLYCYIDPRHHQIFLFFPHYSRWLEATSGLSINNLSLFLFKSYFELCGCREINWVRWELQFANHYESELKKNTSDTSRWLFCMALWWWGGVNFRNVLGDCCCQWKCETPSQPSSSAWSREVYKLHAAKLSYGLQMPVTSKDYHSLPTWIRTWHHAEAAPGRLMQNGAEMTWVLRVYLSK